MISFWRIFSLELLAFLRTKTLLMLTVASAAIMLVMPYALRTDGTEEAFTELYVDYAFGGVFALVTVAVLASASGSLAREREARRLQLTLVRPVRYFTVAFAKTAAHVVAGAAVLAIAGLLMLLQIDPASRCSAVYRPEMVSPAAEALRQYDAYMASPHTPEAVKKAKKSTVLRILADHAADRYDAVATNASRVWKFDLPEGVTAPVVRLHFSAHCGMRQDVRGDVRLGEWYAPITNLTKSVLTIPLGLAQRPAPRDELVFFNGGKMPVMLRPRKDIEVLIAADQTIWNLLRLYLVLVSSLAAIAAFGVFLSSALGRPVAVFTAVVVMISAALGSGVVESCPEDLEMPFADRMGLEISRAITHIAEPVAAAKPIGAFAAGESISWKEVVRGAGIDLVLIPILLAFISALALPRKSENA